MTAKPTYFVVAGSVGEAAFWANDRGLSNNRWRFVRIGGCNELVGFEDPEVMWVGNYQSRGDCEEIRKVLATRRAIPDRAAT